MTRVSSLRGSVEARLRWELAAALVGLSFNAWAVRALDDQAGLDELLRGCEVLDEGVAGEALEGASVPSESAGA